MKLEKILKLEENRQFFEENKIEITVDKKGIKLTLENGCPIFIHRQNHVLPDNQPMIYLDCSIAGIRYPEFRRNWKESENLADYLIKIVIPYSKNIKGPYSITKEETRSSVKENLKSNNLNIEWEGRIDLQYNCVNSLGKMYIDNVNKFVYVFCIASKKYGILCENSCIGLIKFYEINSYEVEYQYSWYSFCPIYKEGKEYVETTISNFLELIEKDKA